MKFFIYVVWIYAWDKVSIKLSFNLNCFDVTIAILKQRIGHFESNIPKFRLAFIDMDMTSISLWFFDTDTLFNSS